MKSFEIKVESPPPYTRSIFLKPADKENPAEIHFVIKGVQGAVCFRLITGWTVRLIDGFKPEPALIAIHHKEITKKTSRYNEHCELLDGPCWFEKTDIDPVPFFLGLITAGPDGLWTHLGLIYKEAFK